MKASGRSLTPRTARSWWTKGFLPPPARRWRRRKSETFWTEADIVERAQATFDFLRTRRRADFVIECLWLEDFAIEPRFLREAYIRDINWLMCAAHTGRLARATAKQRGHGPGDAVYEFARQVALRAIFTEQARRAAPGSAKSAYSNIIADLFQHFYATGEEPDDLVTLYETASPYFDARWSSDLLVYFAESLPSLLAVRDAVESASDHDWTQARRLVRLIRGRLGHAAEGTQFVENEACILMVRDLLRMLVPFMLVLLSNKSIRQFIIVDFLRGSARWKAAIAAYHRDDRIGNQIAGI